ncbi:MAG: HEAT repeat domain-containing protein [Gemmatimonadetes bacterium]|nr:HEAT repeat domain-containing protein [Gemmatimonadota bacterium]MBT6145830.1 HEAT repeat domain-containing protein [Gemmatimonadota bacterium]MBT7861965.1 HEAT repeat domain-containing protein [Gemmatimonadota bacterium]
MADRGRKNTVIVALLAVMGVGLWACSEPSPDPLFLELRSIRAAVREKAAGKLVLYGEQIVPRLIEESQSEFIRVRFEVARILGRIKDPRATDTLIRLLDDRSFNVAQYAAWGLGEIQAPTAVPALLPHLATPSKGFRAQVVAALGRCYDDTVHALLRDSLVSVVAASLRDPTPKVRIAALQSARLFGYQGMEEALIRLSRDPAAEVRHVAVQALGQAGAGLVPGSAGPLSGQERANVVEALVAALDEPFQSIRTKAVRSLEQIGAPEAATALHRLRAVGTEVDRREARRVLESLGAS